MAEMTASMAAARGGVVGGVVCGIVGSIAAAVVVCAGPTGNHGQSHGQDQKQSHQFLFHRSLSILFHNNGERIIPFPNVCILSLKTIDFNCSFCK